MFQKVTPETQLKTGTVLLYHSPRAERTVFGQVLRVYSIPTEGRKATLDFGAAESEAVSINGLAERGARVVGGMSELLAFLNGLGPLVTEMSMKASEMFKDIRGLTGQGAKMVTDAIRGLGGSKFSRK